MWLYGGPSSSQERASILRLSCDDSAVFRVRASSLAKSISGSAVNPLERRQAEFTPLGVGFISRAGGFHGPRSFLACVLSLWLTLSVSHALDPKKRLTQYAHSSMRIQYGFLT